MRYAPNTDSHSSLFHIDGMKPTSMAAQDRIVIVGGFHGDYTLHTIDSHNQEPTTGFMTREHTNGICNHIFLDKLRSGLSIACVSQNDQYVRYLDYSANRIINEFPFEYAINCSAMSPDHQVVSVAGDSTDIVLMSAQNGQVLYTIPGHLDYSFATAWSPCGRMLFSANQGNL